MQQLRAFLRQTPGDRHLLVQTFVLLGVVRLGLWLLSFQALCGLLAKISLICFIDQEKYPIEKLVWAVQRSSHCMPGQVKCLAQALTLQHLLSQSGYPSQLKIGVVKQETGQLEAHAWVESQSQVVIGELRELDRFTPLPLAQSSCRKNRVTNQGSHGKT